jgi:hypothetical protein
MFFGAIASLTDICNEFVKPPNMIEAKVVLQSETDISPITSALIEALM